MIVVVICRCRRYYRLKVKHNTSNGTYFPTVVVVLYFDLFFFLLALTRITHTLWFYSLMCTCTCACLYNEFNRVVAVYCTHQFKHGNFKAHAWFCLVPLVGVRVCMKVYVCCDDSDGDIPCACVFHVCEFVLSSLSARHSAQFIIVCTSTITNEYRKVIFMFCYV